MSAWRIPCSWYMWATLVISRTCPSVVRLTCRGLTGLRAGEPSARAYRPRRDLLSPPLRRARGDSGSGQSATEGPRRRAAGADGDPPLARRDQPSAPGAAPRAETSATSAASTGWPSRSAWVCISRSETVRRRRPAGRPWRAGDGVDDVADLVGDRVDAGARDVAHAWWNRSSRSTPPARCDPSAAHRVRQRPAPGRHRRRGHRRRPAPPTPRHRQAEQSPRSRPAPRPRTRCCPRGRRAACRSATPAWTAPSRPHERVDRRHHRRTGPVCRLDHPGRGTRPARTSPHASRPVRRRSESRPAVLVRRRRTEAAVRRPHLRQHRDRVRRTAPAGRGPVEVENVVQQGAGRVAGLVRCARQPVSRQINQESTVPALAIRPPACSSIHRILGAENIASTRSPVRSRTRSSTEDGRFEHQSAVRTSCQPITGPTASTRPPPAHHRLTLRRQGKPDDVDGPGRP